MNNKIFSEDDAPDFVVPKQFLHKLREFSNGGFILVTITAKNRVIVNYDFADDVSLLALTKGNENFLMKIEETAQGVESMEDQDDEE